MNGVGENELGPEGSFLVVARLCFRNTPYVTLPGSRASNSSLDLLYNLVGLVSNFRHDGLDSILNGADNGVFPSGDAVGTKTSHSQEAEG